MSGTTLMFASGGTRGPKSVRSYSICSWPRRSVPEHFWMAPPVVISAEPVRTRIHPEKIVDVALSKTTVDANDLTIDPLALRTREKCNQAGYVFWRAQAIQWR